MWRTQAYEQVAIGDFVALSLADRRDAIGRIVAEADAGQIQCQLLRGRNVRPGDLVLVEEHHLLLRLYERDL